MKFWLFSKGRCRCGSDRLRRSRRRNTLERALGILLRPWRCDQCDTRCYRAIWVTPQSEQDTKTGKGGLIEAALDFAVRVFRRRPRDADFN